jgi:ABC-type phosphate/phosphonate transport system substrate-binding protein
VKKISLNIILLGTGFLLLLAGFLLYFSGGYKPSVPPPLPLSKSLVFGHLPSSSISKLLKNWGPLLTYLGKELERRVILRTNPDYPTFIKEIQKGSYDIIMVSPDIFLQDEEGHYKALLRPIKHGSSVMLTEEQKIPYGPLAYRTDLDEGLVNELKEALLNLGKTNEGVKILKALKEDIEGFVPAENSDYEEIREYILQAF